jgi:hypothetical protein
VESTYPNLQRATHASWEKLLLDRKYVFAYFDGLNRYYVSDKHRNLLNFFGPGPNYFDGYQLNEDVWSLSDVRIRYRTAVADAEEAVRAAAERSCELEHALSETNSQLSRLSHDLESRDNEISQIRTESSRELNSKEVELLILKMELHHL